MLTIFSTPKPFTGHADVTQRNALRSWTLLHPDVEVILFGNEEGAAEVCKELGIRHEPEVLRNERGTKYLNYMFERAREISSKKFLCYVNCDIMLTPDFCEALATVSRAHEKFLMIGRRWDTDITAPWNFDATDWDQRLRELAQREGKQAGPGWIDYFCFSRDVYHGKMPAFLIGRHGWDPWLTWFAHSSGVPVIDASRGVVAVHQNHDYAYLQKGTAKTFSKADVDYNLQFDDSQTWKFYGAGSATETLRGGRLETNRMAWFGPMRARSVYSAHMAWFFGLKITRPIRHLLGLRKRVGQPSY